MDFIEIGERAITLCKRADFGERGNVAVHRIDGFKGYELGAIRCQCFQFRFEISQVIVTPDQFFAAAMADAFDHGGMVQFVGQHDAIGQSPDKGRQGGFIGHVAGIEQEGRVLAMQVSQFLLEFDMIMRGAGNVAGAARTGADVIDGCVHGGENGWMLAHAEIIIGAPHGDFALFALPAVKRTGKPAPDTADIGKFAVTALRPQPVNALLPECDHSFAVS